MLEERPQPLVPLRKFFARLLRSSAAAMAVVSGSLAIGICGYRHFEHLSWLDSLLNASMILSSMGPVTPLQTVGGKWFASFYALFSGVVFITVISVLAAPIAHRVLHQFHLARYGEPPSGEKRQR